MGTPTRSPLLPVETFLTREPDRTVARAALSLTLYLDDPRRWAREWASACFELFVDRIDPCWLRWFGTSQEERWHPIDSLVEIREGLAGGRFAGKPRHLLTVRVADDRGAPAVGFVYREVDPQLSPTLGYVQMHFPLDTDPDELLELAIEVGQTFAIRSGVGGYAFTWDRDLPRNAFRAMYTYCKRFLGVDVQHPDAFAWRAASGLTGVSWLTLVGSSMAQAEAVRALTWSDAIAVLPLAHATLLRAGPSPTAGDLNLMEHPTAIAEVSRALAPFVIEDPPPFPGPFSENDEGRDVTGDWMQRFSFPERWP
jgi:hypothetical protein